ncbi:hypothetical protein L3Q82_017023 [Scortum barcoo]|uniref:Uncharacterized protein n=1 Tax=Scortum barcoo TaxID=214431 RepID=A0ACB8X959_9TELE|nr:hypothetical protein L3Q82_017023 [Scortum barcoo]
MGKQFERVNNIKFLGIHITSDLTWSMNTAHLLQGYNREHPLPQCKQCGMAAALHKTESAGVLRWRPATKSEFSGAVAEALAESTLLEVNRQKSFSWGPEWDRMRIISEDRRTNQTRYSSVYESVTDPTNCDSAL